LVWFTSHPMSYIFINVSEQKFDETLDFYFLHKDSYVMLPSLLTAD
jgi:hypothetical protein